jgi:hypothetical protein
VPDKDVMTVRIDGVLNGGDVLPGFQLPVRKIFPLKAQILMPDPPYA